MNSSSIEAFAGAASVAAAFGSVGVAVSIGVSLAHNEISGIVEAAIRDVTDHHGVKATDQGEVTLTVNDVSADRAEAGLRANDLIRRVDGTHGFALEDGGDAEHEEGYRFEGLIRTPEAQRLMRAFMERGGQTREAELRLGELCLELEGR